jgi:O-antigen ligase
MNLITLKTNQLENYFSILLAFIPFSFIAGNLIINLNIILLILSALFFFGKDLFKIKYYNLDKLIFILFLFILIPAFLNDYFFYTIKSWKGYSATIIKTLFFFKYYFLYLSLRFLIEKNFINLKFFFLSCTLASLFVCFDIFYQFVNGQDIFGFKPLANKMAGPFGDELIAGGFIQRFSIFSFFVIPLFYSQKNLKKNLKLITPILFIIFLIGIILSGNRMPFILFIFTMILIVIFQKQTRKYFLSFMFISLTVFFLIFKAVPQVNANSMRFYNQISIMTKIVLKKDFYNEPPFHLKEFVTFYDTWLMHKYLGGGIKNFRYYCHHRDNIGKNPHFICNMHPHNYYLEILTELGIVGFLIICSIFLTVLFISFCKKYSSKSQQPINNLLIPFIFLFIAEIFPIKSTGSFFTTGNTTYLFLIMSILVALVRKYNFIENKS